MGINSLIDDAIGLAKSNPVVTALGAGAVGVGLGVGAAALIGSKSKKGNRRTHTKRGWKQDRKRFNKRQKWEVAYRKRKAKKKRNSGKHTKRGKTRRGKIYYARKTGQPYIILKNGKARFIKGKRRSR